MRLRHAAALALAGWYLMLPPVSGIGVVRGDAPLSQWSIDGSYDSARDCANAKTQRRAHIEMPLPGEKPGEITEQGMAVPRLVWDSALCIATDDPRLKGK